MSEGLSHVGVVRSVVAGEALVAVPTQGCSGCGRRAGCGIGQLAGTQRVTLVRVAASPELRPGDSVTLEVSQSALNRAALVGYLLPAAMLVLGTVAGEFAGKGEGGAILGAVGGLAAGVLLVRILPGFVRGLRAPLVLESDR